MRQFFVGIIVIIISLGVFGNTKSICEGVDDRQRSFDGKIARTRNSFNENTSRSATLIGKSCMISAGHCVGYLRYAEFNVPLSYENGNVSKAANEDIYEIDQDSLQTVAHYIGRDWSVFKVSANNVTRRLPGEISGYYEVDFENPINTKEVRITGYGTSSVKDLNYVQKTDFGMVVSLEESIIRYWVDTTGGNSGSAIIDNDTRKIIGIHTNGSCDYSYGSNYGTTIYGNQKLQGAIKKCLSTDK